MPVSPEEDWDYWDKKAIELWRTQTASVNSSATKWSALTAALLGVFATVAFAGGLSTIATLGHPWRIVAQVLTTLAVGSAVASIVLLGIAAGGLGTAHIDHPLDGAEAKRRHTSAVASSLAYLKVGRWLSALTVLIVVAGSLMILWIGEPANETGKAGYMVVFGDSAVCGDLSTGADGSLSIGGRRLDGEVKTVMQVTSCGQPSP